jgi:calcium-dependent protein kinase
MAPEILRGEYSEKCDLWSAGVILFVILAGYHPFYEEEEEGIIKKIVDLEYDFEGRPQRFSFPR